MLTRLRPLATTAAIALGLAITSSIVAQPRQRPEPEIEGQPRTPTAVALPTLSAAVTGPGAMFDSRR
jgi:hypothetical protein